MNIFFIILKFIASFIAISSTLLYLGNYINAFNASKILFSDKESKEVIEEAARYRIKLGLIMAIAWAIVISI